VESQSASEADPQKPKVDVEFRRRQWDLLDSRSRKALGVTFEEFLKLDNYTGYGANSKWTEIELPDA